MASEALTVSRCRIQGPKGSFRYTVPTVYCTCAPAPAPGPGPAPVPVRSWQSCRVYTVKTKVSRPPVQIQFSHILLRGRYTVMYVHCVLETLAKVAQPNLGVSRRTGLRARPPRRKTVGLETVVLSPPFDEVLHTHLSPMSLSCVCCRTSTVSRPSRFNVAIFCACSTKM